MKHLLRLVTIFLLAVWGTILETHASLRIPILIVSGHEEEITEMGELSPEVSTAVAEEIGTDLTLDFIHERTHVFWLDLWTWNGRHVLHSGDKSESQISKRGKT